MVCGGHLVTLVVSMVTGRLVHPTGQCVLERCVPLTQLPLAFCAGSKKNDAPEPSPILPTVPSTVTEGFILMLIVTSMPERIRLGSIYLKFALIYQPSIGHHQKL
jgi:hypothetical protein